MHLRNGRIGIFDLSTNVFAEEDLIGDHSQESVSSVRMGRALMGRHGPDSIVLGTGVLTGSLIPASCAGTILSGQKLMPLLGHAGSELKLSGFDFIVVKGKAIAPGYLWIRDGIVDFVEMPEAHGMDSWQRTDKVRTDQGDSKIQVVSAGSWCDAASPASSLTVDYWGGEDKAGVGAEFGRKNLVAVAFRGMGELEVADAEAHYSASVSLIKDHLSRLGPGSGLTSYTMHAGRDDFVALVHRTTGCFGCPFPCRTFLKTEEDPGEMRLVHKEPGYLHYDALALAKAFELGLDARESTRILAMCARAGAEPSSVLAACSAGGRKVDLESVKGLLAKPAEIGLVGGGNFEQSMQESRDYEVCLGLGLCPRYWGKVGFDLASISKCAEPALGSRLP